MRLLSYRNKRVAKAILLILAILTALFLLFYICRFVYVQRFLVYSPNGVRLDYSQDLQSDRIQPSQQNPEDFPVTILRPESSTTVSSQANDQMHQLSGFYVTTAMLQDIPAVQEALAEQSSVYAVMFDMKSIYGNFYYNSEIPNTYQAGVDIFAIENLLASLSKDGVYLIARIPAFRDNNYALEHQTQGLPLSSGALWMDSSGCYWLDPLHEDVQGYLITIAEELSEMGFDEVVFSDFYFPDSNNIVYTDDVTRSEAVAQAAKAIQDALHDSSIRVSFASSDPLVAAHADRLYLSADTGSTVSQTVEPLLEYIKDPTAQIVFLTASRDTRFNIYGILRPIIEEDG